MKRLLPILGMICTLSSCIYDSPNDNFYRTLWVSEEAPFSEIGQATESSTDGATSTYEHKSSSTSGRVTLEFLCGGSICVTATGAAGSYGTYQSFDNSAYFVGLSLTYYGDGATVISSYREAEDGDNGTTDDDTATLSDMTVSEYGETSDNSLRDGLDDGLGDGLDYGSNDDSDDETKSQYYAYSAQIIIEEAHRTGDILLVSWHREGSPTSYSTRFVRRSSYE